MNEQKIFELCMENNIPEGVYEEIKNLFTQERLRIQAEQSDLIKEKRKFETLCGNQKQIIKEQGERFKSKIMSVYYLMGAVAKMGTHREKEIAIRFIQCSLEDIIRGSDLSWDQDLFNIPF